MKINKKMALLYFFIFGLAITMVSIKSKYYIYGYYRIVNGNEFESFNSRLASGFYFYKKDNGNYVVFHRDFDAIPMYLDENKKVNFQIFLDKKIGDKLHSFNACTIYRDNASTEDIYIDFGVIDGILGVSDASPEILKILCGMLQETP